MAKKTYDALKSAAEMVRLETMQGANTAERIGSLFMDIIDSILHGTLNENLLKQVIRKDKDDLTQYLVTFLKGLKIGENGSGITVLRDGTTQAVVDRLQVNIKAYFEELEIKKRTYVGGSNILTHAGMKCVKVDELEHVYRCFMKAEVDGVRIAQSFTVGTLAYMEENNIEVGISLHAGNRYYWREVTAVGPDYIELSKTICDPNNVNDVPLAGDDIIGFGHRTDIKRQGAISMSSVGANSPSIIFYQGICDFSLENKTVVEMYFDETTGHANVKVYGELYVGDRPEKDKKAKSYMKYTPKDGLKVKGSLIVENEKGEDEELTQKMLQDMLNAQKRLDSWIADGFISPLEKKELKDEIVRITADKDYIVKSYTTYSLGSPTALIKAFNAYKKMLTDLSVPEPECIPVPDNFKTVMENFYTQKRLAMEQINTTISSTFSTLDNQLFWETYYRQQGDDGIRKEMTTQFTAQNGKIEGVISSVETIGDRVTATETRLTQTENSITAQATKISEQGESLSALSVKVDGISSTVTTANSTATSAKELAEKANGLASSAVTDASNALTKAGLAVGDASSALSKAEEALGTANTAKENAATAIQQSSSAVSIIAAKFNADGSLKNTSGLVVTSDFTALQTRMGDAEAIISTCVTKDEYGNLVGTVYIRGDQVKFDAGTYTINADHVNFNSGTYKISADHIDLSGVVAVSLKNGEKGNDRTVIEGNTVVVWALADRCHTHVKPDCIELNNAAYSSVIWPDHAYFANGTFGMTFGVHSDGRSWIKSEKWSTDRKGGYTLVQQNEAYVDTNGFLRVKGWE